MKSLDITRYTVSFINQLDAIAKIEYSYTYCFPDATAIKLFFVCARNHNNELDQNQTYRIRKLLQHFNQTYEHIYFELSEHDSYHNQIRIHVTIDYMNIPDLLQQFNQTVTFNTLVDSTNNNSIDIIFNTK
jgi:hypothetical protein